MLAVARDWNFFKAGKLLPYDAEVEYLESTGTQWIDTGVFHDTANTVRFKLKIPNRLGTWDGPYADYINEQMRTTRLINSQTIRGAVFLYHATTAGGGSTRFENMLLDDSSITLEGYTSPNEYFLNGVVKSPAHPSIAGVATRTMKLFFNNALSPIASRFYYFRIDNQCDLIPVRFTNEQGQTEGAMYDRLGVGGMNPDGSARNDGLYRNRGTGAFVRGSDK